MHEKIKYVIYCETGIILEKYCDVNFWSYRPALMFSIRFCKYTAQFRGCGQENSLKAP